MSTTEALQQRIEALEIKAAYADDLLEELNLTIYKQQQQIDRLMACCAICSNACPSKAAVPACAICVMNCHRIIEKLAELIVSALAAWRVFPHWV